jgi:hypothetical protein
MRSIAITSVATVAAVALMVACLWAWQSAGHFAIDANRPYVATLAARTAAIALAAAAQVIILTLVIGRIYRRELVDDVLKLTAAAVMLVAIVGAVALALAAR